MKMKTIITMLIIAIIFLAGCTNTSRNINSIPKPVSNGEPAIFTDEDIDNAELSLASEAIDITSLEGQSLTTSSLSTQTVQAGAAGYIYFIENDTDAIAVDPWRVYRFDQTSDTLVKIYEGEREIESVSGSEDGNTLAISMKETINPRSDYEIFRLIVSPAKVQKITSGPEDKTNVSMSGDGQRIAWQSIFNSKDTIYIRIYLNPSSNLFAETFLKHSQDQRYPSLSSNGLYLVLIRHITSNNRDQVQIYNINAGSYELIAGTSSTKRDPSISDDGKKIVWLEPGGQSKVKLNNVMTGSISTIVSSSRELSHPFVTGDGKWISHSRLDGAAPNERFRIYTKNLVTGNIQRGTFPPAGINHTGSYWQKPNPFAKEIKRTPFDGVAGDFFGISVAIDGNTMVVGANKDDDNGSSSGSAYILDKLDGAWVPIAKLTASDGADSDFFGLSVGISGDTVVVGANLDDDNESNSGSAYIYERNEGGSNNWGEVTKITASDGADNDRFGLSVGISGDTMVVGSRFDDDNGGNSGSAYIYERNEGGSNNWGEVTKITASDRAAFDLFGRSVGISGDTVVVGANFDDDNGSDSGSAYIYERNEGGSNNWGEVTKITASDGADNDRFGLSVGISGDTVVVGANFDDDNGSDSGSAYIYERNEGGSNNWGEVSKKTASDGAANDLFGLSVGISGDTVVVGAHKDDDNGSLSGSAYIYERNEGGSNNWGEVSKKTASDGAANDLFGGSVGISGDTVVVGANFDDDNGSDSGSVYIYE